MNAYLLTAVVITILSVARTARLLVFDSYPPAAWLRDKWDDLTVKPGRRADWNMLLHCAFCATPYLAAGLVAWAYFAVPGGDPWDTWSAAWWWFLVNGTWGGSYLAAILVAYDQPGE